MRCGRVGGLGVRGGADSGRRPDARQAVAGRPRPAVGLLVVVEAGPGVRRVVAARAAAAGWRGSRAPRASGRAFAASFVGQTVPGGQGSSTAFVVAFGRRGWWCRAPISVVQ